MDRVKGTKEATELKKRLHLNKDTLCPENENVRKVLDKRTEKPMKEQIENPQNRALTPIVPFKIILALFALVILCYFLFDSEGNAKLHKSMILVGNSFPFLNDWMRAFHQKDKVSTKQRKPAPKNFNKHDWMAGPSKDRNLKLLTDGDIKYEEGGKLFLVLIGHVFDVSSGFEYYKPGSGYHGFVGRDGSRAFVSGEFTEDGFTNDLEGLEAQDYNGLADWLKFYLEHETYKFVGYHIGRFFDENGKETESMADFKEMVLKAEEESKKDGDLKKLFPTCNIDWTREKGTTVWCSENSGGIARDWIGYPRKFFEAPSKDARCACVHANFLADPRVKTYKDCEINASACKVMESDKS